MKRAKSLRLIAAAIAVVIALAAFVACSGKPADNGKNDQSANGGLTEAPLPTNVQEGEPSDTLNPAAEIPFKAVRKAYQYIPENVFPATTAGSTSYVWVYDLLGHVVKCYSQFSVNIFEYNEKGYVSKQYIPSNGGSGSVWTYEYQYSDNGKPSVVVRTYSGPTLLDVEPGETMTFTYCYDGDKIISIDEVLRRRGSTVKTTHYILSYNENSDLSAIRWYSESSPDFRYYIFFDYENKSLTKTRYGYNQLPETNESYIQSSIEYNEYLEPVRLSFGSDATYYQYYEYDENGSLCKLNNLSYDPPAIEYGDLTQVQIEEPTEEPIAESLAKNVQVGDYVIFGSYEQDNSSSNGKEDIEWLVLARDGDRVLVISKYALDCQQYNTSDTSVTWETCSLREWLNDTFINSAFSPYEQATIQTTTVTADKNPSYSTSPGKDTTDKVFLLSIADESMYFNSDSARQCKGTDYCYAQGAYKNSNGNCWWWLRSPGQNSDRAAYINYGGSVYDIGIYVNIDMIAVRPALWINLGS